MNEEKSIVPIRKNPITIICRWFEYKPRKSKNSSGILLKLTRILNDGQSM